MFFQDDLEDLIVNWDESESIGDIFLKYVRVLFIFLSIQIKVSSHQEMAGNESHLFKCENFLKNLGIVVFVKYFGSVLVF